MGRTKYQAHFPIRRCFTIEYASSKGTMQMPKYFVNAAALIKAAERHRFTDSSFSNPLNHRSTAQTQNASISVSLITLVAETITPGVNKVASAASNGE